MIRIWQIILSGILVALLLNVGATGCLASQEGNEGIIFTKLGEIFTGGDAYDVWVKNELAFVTCGYLGLKIFDVSDPSNITEVGHLPASSGGYAHQLFIANDLVYIGGGQAGLEIINISDPSSPQRVTRYKEPATTYPWAVQVVGNIAFLANGYITAGAGLSILDISNHTSPILLGNYSTDGDATDIEVIGNLVYLTSSFGRLTILDVSNYSNPILVGQYTGQSGLNAEVGDVKIVGNLAFLTYWSSGLKILDINDPSNIVKVGEYTDGGEYFSIKVSNNLA
ncbi:MAG: LVIVD repeat-containing protein, partial [Candidatus Hodarchaeota archaeon]